MNSLIYNEMSYLEDQAFECFKVNFSALGQIKTRGTLNCFSPTPNIFGRALTTQALVKQLSSQFIEKTPLWPNPVQSWHYLLPVSTINTLSLTSDFSLLRNTQLSYQRQIFSIQAQPLSFLLYLSPSFLASFYCFLASFSLAFYSFSYYFRAFFYSFYASFMAFFYSFQAYFYAFWASFSAFLAYFSVYLLALSSNVKTI